VLQVNGISAVPYHAGRQNRAKHQDMFLMEDVDVVAATIAFGMELINRCAFVIHHDIPKSTRVIIKKRVVSRWRRHCLAYYSYKDVEN
jgi:ATP-dependent DNA helicase RecQ